MLQGWLAEKKGDAMINELQVAERIANGTLPSPQEFGSTGIGRSASVASARLA